jgi:hypothetical protein
MVTGPASSWFASFGRGAMSFALRVAFVLVLFEGAASLVLFTLELPQQIRIPADMRRHTRHDAELGWVNLESIELPNLYGPGRGLTLNAQGLRARESFPAAEPQNRVRVVCSGSGHTLGRGVADDIAWCAQLEALLPGLETVNMGQYGYGVDQSYLWYMRDGLALDHSIQLFAVSRPDFGRMQSSSFEHRGKPTLRLANGSLEVDDVPVPLAPHKSSWIATNAAVLARLRGVQLVRPLVDSLIPPPNPTLTTGELADLSLGVFDALAEVHATRGSRLVLVYLPTFEDYEAPRDLWRRRIRSLALERGYHFVDLVEEIKRLSRRDAAALYHPNGGRPAFSDAGHAWVARALVPHLAPARPRSARLEALRERE